MNLEDLIIDLNTIGFYSTLADELVEILESEHCADQTTGLYIERLRSGELSFFDCVDQVMAYLKSCDEC